eukprot:g3552.t1
MITGYPLFLALSNAAPDFRQEETGSTAPPASTRPPSSLSHPLRFPADAVFTTVPWDSSESQHPDKASIVSRQQVNNKDAHVVLAADREELAALDESLRTGRADGFDVMLCSRFKPGDYEEFLSGQIPLHLMQPIAVYHEDDEVDGGGGGGGVTGGSDRTKPSQDSPGETESDTVSLVMRPMNNYSVNLVGGVVVTVHRGTVDNGNFKENAELYGQEYVRAMQERLKTEGPGSLARLAPKNASFTNREVLVDEGLQALARANIRGLESHPDQLLRFTQQDYSELDVAFPYGRGFYYLFDPKWTREEAAIALRELLASPYFKEDTRMIQVSLWYSADTWASVDIAVLFSVEISQNGFCFPHWGFRAIPIHSLKIADVCILVLYGVWGTQALVQVWKIMRLCCLRMCCSLYMTNVWNWWDWINFATFLLFSLRYYQIHRETQTWHPSAAGDCYMTSIAHVQVHVWQKVRTSYFTQFGIMMAITCWRSLKYLQLSPVLLVPKLALSRGGSEILAMLIVFMIMTLGFGWLFHVKYYMHPEFSSVTSSCLSLLCIITQTLDPDQFFSEDGFGKDYTKEGKLMAAVFTFVCSFILLNIFIGIMTCHYVSVQEQYG